MERPILFSGPMVKAILNGTKTQTRRIVKPLPSGAALTAMVHPIGHAEFYRNHRCLDIVRCPYGKPGDRLWVRETWAPNPEGPGTVYRADGDFDMKFHGDRWRPSIHMPRWASRITLEVVSVRVERLQDISEADAIAEGVWDGNPVWPPNKDLCPVCHGQRVYEGGSMSGAIERDCTFCDTNVKRYKALWQHINGCDSWEASPWVWVVTFRKLDQP